MKMTWIKNVTIPEKENEGRSIDTAQKMKTIRTSGKYLAVLPSLIHNAKCDRTEKMKRKKAKKSKKRARKLLQTSQQVNPAELLMPWKKYIEADTKAQSDLPIDSFE